MAASALRQGGETGGAPVSSGGLRRRLTLPPRRRTPHALSPPPLPSAPPVESREGQYAVDALTKRRVPPTVGPGKRDHGPPLFTFPLPPRGATDRGPRKRDETTDSLFLRDRSPPLPRRPHALCSGLPKLQPTPRRSRIHHHSRRAVT